nr:hypothetical protein [Tanacetum cinerariifolium]
MDDEPMWATDRVVASTLGFAITIPETENKFAIKGSSNSDTNKIMARMDAMTIKMDAKYKELHSRAKQSTPDLDDDDMPMSREEELNSCKLSMITATETRIVIIGVQADVMITTKTNTDDKPYDLQRKFNDFMKSQQSTNAFVKETFMKLKTQLETVAKNHQASI